MATSTHALRAAVAASRGSGWDEREILETVCAFIDQIGETHELRKFIRDQIMIDRTVRRMKSSPSPKRLK